MDHRPLLPVDAAAGATATKAARRDLNAWNGLRGVCAVAIVAGHFFTYFTPLAPPDGQLGSAYPAFPLPYLQPVTMFFLLSGSSLGLFYADAASWRPFLWKRVARIVPVYYLALLLSLPALVRYWSSNPVYEGVATLVLSPLFLQSVTLVGNTWCGPLWQVSALAVCYALFPCLVRRLRCHTPAALAVIATACWLLPLAAMVAVVATGAPAGVVHTWFVTRFPHFVVGVVLGLVLKDEAAWPTVVSWVSRPWVLEAAVACVVGVDAAAIVLGYRFNVGWTWAFMNVAEFALVPLHCIVVLGLACVGPTRLSPTRRFLGHAMVQGFGGQASYSLYCLHYPVMYYLTWLASGWHTPLATANRHFHMGTDGTVEGPFGLRPYQLLSVLAITMVLAAVLHDMVEGPCRRRIARLGSPASGAAAAVAVGSAGRRKAST